jgi:hypothetical protein
MEKKKLIEMKCEICGKDLLKKDWYKCYEKYFCSLPHLEQYEKTLEKK